MAFPGLILRSVWLAALLFTALGAARPARADGPVAPRVSLALAAEPGPGHKTVVDEPTRAATDETPTSEGSHGSSSWWVWVVMGAAAAGVGALIITSAGKDPACPAGRTCQ